MRTEMNQGHLMRSPVLKGHSQLWDRADLDTTFASLKIVQLNPKSTVLVRYI